MYIAEIDDILDQTLDKYMYTWIIESKFKELINIETIMDMKEHDIMNDCQE